MSGITQAPADNRDQQVCDNMGLVHACARRFIGRGLEYDDLFQAGCVGLIKAVDGFDRSRGLCFSTYAVPVILGEIRRLFRDGGQIKVSRSLKELSLRVSRERERFIMHEGAEPTLLQLAERMQLEPAQVAQALEVMLPAVSLTRSGDSDEGEEWQLPVRPPDDEVVDHLALRQAMSGLDRRDQRLLTMRYLQHCTQTVTAQQLGMTQVQVSRRERVLLQLLREKLTG